MGLIYHCGCVDDHCLSPYQTRATWLPWLLRKSTPFVFKYRPLGPIYFNICLHIYYCWCVDDHLPITIPNQSQLVALVAKKKQALYILI